MKYFPGDTLLMVNSSVSFPSNDKSSPYSLGRYTNFVCPITAGRTIVL